MGSDRPPQPAAPQETPEARRLTELQAQRLEYLNPLEQQALGTLTPLQTQAAQQQYQTNIGLQPLEAALRQQELGTAGQRQSTIGGILGGQLPTGFEGVGAPLTPISLQGEPYDQAFETARGRLLQEEERRNAQIAAQQNLAGVLTSGGTHEMLRRSGVDTSQQLAELSTQQAFSETERQRQEALLGRQAEQDLIGRQSALLNTGLGLGPLATSAVQSPGLNPLGGVQQGFAGAASGIQQANALQQQQRFQQQQLMMQMQQGQGQFFGDIFGGLLSAGTTLGAAAIISSRDYKNNITENTVDSIAVLKDIEVVEFDYKPEFKDTKHHVGMIAEDTPEILTTDNGKALDMMNIVGVLVDANKKLIDRVEALEGRDS